MEETEYNIIIKQHSEYPYFSMNRGKNHKFDIVWNLEIGWFSNRIHAAEIEIKEWNSMVEYLGTSPLQSSEIFRNYFLFLSDSNLNIQCQNDNKISLQVEMMLCCRI